MRALDTTPTVDEMQIDVWRGLTAVERADLLCEMCDRAFDVARAGIRSRHPQYGEHDVQLALIRLLHGDELARAASGDGTLREP